MIMRKLIKLGKYLGVKPPDGRHDDAEFARQTEAAEAILERYRNAFRELAK